MLGFFKTLMFFDWTQPLAAMLINPDGGLEIIVDSEDTWAAIEELAENGIIVRSFISHPFNKNKTCLYVDWQDALDSGIRQKDYIPRSK